MKSSAVFAVLLGCAAAAWAQSPASSFPRGKSLQAWQHPGLRGVLAKCQTPPQPFSIPVQPATTGAGQPAPPPNGTAPAGFDRDTGRDRRRAGLEGRLVVGRQQRRRHHRRRPRHDAVREQRREQRHEARSRDWAGHHHSPRREHRRRPVAQQERCAVPRVERIALGRPASAAGAQGAGQLTSKASRSNASVAC